MTLKVKITFDRLPTDHSARLRHQEIHGDEVPFTRLITGDVKEIPELEARLSRLLGLTVTIESETV